MGAISDLRASLADALTGAGMRVEPVLPVAFTPPLALILGADPWLTVAGAPRQGMVRFDVVVVAGAGTNPEAARRLDDYVEAALLALLSTDHPWQALQASAPYDLLVPQSGQERTYLAARLTCERPIIIST